MVAPSPVAQGVTVQAEGRRPSGGRHPTLGHQLDERQPFLDSVLRRVVGHGSLTQQDHPPGRGILDVQTVGQGHAPPPPRMQVPDRHLQGHRQEAQRFTLPPRGRLQAREIRHGRAPLHGGSADARRMTAPLPGPSPLGSPGAHAIFSLRLRNVQHRNACSLYEPVCLCCGGSARTARFGRRCSGLPVPLAAGRPTGRRDAEPVPGRVPAASATRRHRRGACLTSAAAPARAEGARPQGPAPRGGLPALPPGALVQRSNVPIVPANGRSLGLNASLCPVPG